MSAGGLIRQSFVVIGGFSFMGYMFFKATEGTDDDLYKKFEDKGKDENSYNKDQLISQILRGGGKKSLSELREETTKMRYKIADENTVYNVPVQPSKEPSKES
eukprot:TRINITY_DN6734_c0_g1_i2.p1 TRINITY_DN6734_c0_g1~~TRINITY_DN6734_c0_g1_i2.p1  ORF type:complete len:103 (-),score=22.29 TRINITY_DN6734_c0_g1_i2:179-487(-)